jgi:hypothetical protein
MKTLILIASLLALVLTKEEDLRDKQLVLVTNENVRDIIY